jgi:hypothetical protein
VVDVGIFTFENVFLGELHVFYVKNVRIPRTLAAIADMADGSLADLTSTHVLKLT